MSSVPPSGVRVTYRQQYRRCGKAACTRCAAGGQGHGPYWYAVWWEDGRTHTRYLGKAPPALTEDEPTLPAVAPESPQSQPVERLRVQTLGAFAVWRDTTLLPVSTWAHHRSGSLFKWLLAAPRYQLSRDRAVELLWPEASPRTGAGNLRVLVYRLRRALGESPETVRSVLSYDGEILALAQDSTLLIEVDANAFVVVATEALNSHDRSLCAKALSLYGGDYLPEDLYEEWAVGRREELRLLYRRLLLHLATLCRSDGAVEEAEGYLYTLLASDRCHEEAALLLMRLHLAAGRAGAALRVYRQLAEALREELDLAPCREARQLAAQLLHSQRAAAPPSPRPAAHTNLPEDLSTFIGRGRELAALRAALMPGRTAGTVPGRLLTLVGPGGIGKTRLALALAGELLESYPGGVWLVDLSGLAADEEEDTLTVAATTASALRLREEPMRPLLNTITAHLSTQRTLLLLDNCEHVLPACASLVAALLAACPGLQILATSRETLGVSGEQPWSVPSLSLPQEGLTLERLSEAEACRLFLARARLQRPALEVTEPDVPAMVTICRQLDGHPLALELAAARVGVLSIQGIAARLQQSLHLLTGGSRSAPGRQRTLRATLDWSYGLLRADEQRLFRRLAVFAGGSTLEAMEAICGEARDEAQAVDSVRVPMDSGCAAAAAPQDQPFDAWTTLDLLTALVRKSLVVADDQVSGGWYRLLETVRQYAMERLRASGELQRLRARHLSFFVSLAETTEASLVGPQQEAALKRLVPEIDNLRAALHTARETGSIELGLRLVCALSPFWRLRCDLHEGRQWLEQMLAQLAEQPEARDEPAIRALQARALRMAGVFSFDQGDYEHAVAYGERSLQLLRETGDRRGIAMVLNNLGNVADQRGDYARSQALFDESLSLLRALGDTVLVMRSLNNHGIAARNRGEYQRARTLLTECLALARTVGDSDSVARACTNLSTLAFLQGEYDEATALAEESLARQTALGNKTGMSSALRNLGNIAFQLQDFALARERHEAALATGMEGGDRSAVALTLCNLGAVAQEQGDGALAEERYLTALTHYRDMGVKEGEATTLAYLAGLQHRRGEIADALAHYRWSRDLYRELQDWRGIAITLEGTALIVQQRQQFVHAATLYGAAAALRQQLHAPLSPLERARHSDALAATRLALGDGAFDKAWAAGGALSPDEMIAHAQEPLSVTVPESDRS